MEVRISRQAQKTLERLEKAQQKKIIGTIAKLEQEGPFSLPYKKIRGIEGTFRARTGEYRIVYCLEDKNILILKIGKRENIYE